VLQLESELIFDFRFCVSSGRPGGFGTGPDFTLKQYLATAARVVDTLDGQQTWSIVLWRSLAVKAARRASGFHSSARDFAIAH